MSKAPAFQIYAADIYMDTNEWSAEAVGIYTRLLFHQWVNGSIPGDHKKLAQISLVSIKKFSKRWPEMVMKFEFNGTQRGINLRLEQTRQDQAKYIESQREKGKKRWKDTHAVAHAVAHAVVKPVHEPKGCSSSSSSSSSNNNKTIINNKTINNKTRELKLSCPHKEIVEAYNEILGHVLPPVKYELWRGSEREEHLKARWNFGPKYQTIEYWRGLFKYILGCPHLIGENSRGWKANLGWVVNKSNFIKIVEGQYDPNKKNF